MPVKGMLSLYIGGMGARDKNFYNDYAKRLGYEGEAKKIQDLYLDGKKLEAMAAVPDRWWTRSRWSARPAACASAWPRGRRSGVTDLILGAGQPEALELLAGRV